jgi:hypothetical protein
VGLIPCDTSTSQLFSKMLHYGTVFSLRAEENDLRILCHGHRVTGRPVEEIAALHRLL